MQLQKIKVKSIKKLDYANQVYDLSVEKNRNFFIGNTEILTHNCDYMTPNGQAALRNLMETFSATTRFILTCNYVEKIIDPIQSRCQTFAITPPSKKDVAIRVDNILKNEKVAYNQSDLVTIINAGESIEDKAKNLVNGIKEHYQRIGELALTKRAEINAKKESGSYIPIIGMGHLFAAGGVSGDGVRDLYVGSLAYVNVDVFPTCFDYVALGHLHIPQRLADSEYIRYSGSPLAMGFGEANQKKKMLLVEISPNAEKNIKEISVPIFQDLMKISGDLNFIKSELVKLIKAESSAWLEIDYT